MNGRPHTTVRAAGLLLLAGVLVAPDLHASAPKKKQNQPPAITISAPLNGATFQAEAAVSVTATASDSDGTVAAVRFLIDAKPIGTATHAPYVASWAEARPGVHRITAIAFDNLGAQTSAHVTVTVQPYPPPTVALTAPASDSVFVAPATIALSANVTGRATRLKSVQFFAGSKRIGVATRPPYRMEWRNAPLGSHTLTAVLFSHSHHARATSPPVHVTVKKNTPPSVTMTAPATGGIFTAPARITVTADASDVDGTVKRVDFYTAGPSGRTLIGSRLSAPYEVDWTDVAAGSYAIKAVATDDRGLRGTSSSVHVTVNVAAPDPPAPTSAPLIQPANLVYQGAFRVPDGSIPGPNLNEFQAASALLNFGGTALAFNPDNASLFIVGHDWTQLVAEISVPAVVNGATPDDLARATVLQPLTDVTDGLMYLAHPDATVKIGGLLPYNHTLYVTAYDYYDGLGSQVVSHFQSALDLSVPDDVRGPYQVGGTPGVPGFAGFVDGYFGRVPADWQTLLGGPVLNGNCCLSIIGRTSFGPAVFAIDPAQLGTVDPLPATPLVYYPITHPLAPGDTRSPYFNLATEVKGVVFPERTRSVLFFGRHGTGDYCYGPGTDDPNLAGQPADEGVDTWCYDPENFAKGTHAFPYNYYVWAYDANDLVAVKEGRTQPWDVLPYATWPLSLPFGTGGQLLGATYDPATGRIFVSQAYGEGELPVIHVLTVQVP